MHFLQTSVYLITITFTLRQNKCKPILSLWNGLFPFKVITNKKYSLKSSQKSSKMKCLAKAHIQNTETKWFPFVSCSALCDLQMIPCGGESLHHLILVVGDIARQAACQEYPNELEECNSKRNSSNNTKIGLHRCSHQSEAAPLIYH